VRDSRTPQSSEHPTLAALSQRGFSLHRKRTRWYGFYASLTKPDLFSSLRAEVGSKETVVATRKKAVGAKPKKTVAKKSKKKVAAIPTETVLDFTFKRAGNPRTVKMKVECELTAPKPNNEHEELEGVAPLKILCGEVYYYPIFQRFKGKNTLYRNIATCIMCFRKGDPRVSDFDIVMWFFTPNELLGWKTPVEVGRDTDKNVRTRIIEAAEEESPLGIVR